MKRFGGIWICLVIFLYFATPINAETNATVFVSETGNSVVMLQITGQDTTEVMLPLDVSQPSIKGGLYVLSENGIKVAAKDVAVVIYKTDLFTFKQGANWTFETDLLGHANTKIKLPSHAIILETGGLIDADTNEISFDDSDIRLTYTFGEKPAENEKKTWIYLIILAIILLAIAGIMIFLKKSQEPTGESTEGTNRQGKGQANVIKTLSSHQAKLVELIMQNNGEIKRNKLERISGYAKSSLASCLNSLERKKIIEIDKTSAVHYVRLTEWFKGL
ncbi:hypothetical protein JW968_01265 [Candidatus Woesearchaeota archaeon]|nr:hypothetical protein [Candidatus Woesearchaeota archaeon]